MDWSGAHYGDPYCDLGRFATLSGLSACDASFILREYQGLFSEQDVRHLQHCIAMFDMDYFLFVCGNEEMQNYIPFFHTKYQQSRQLVEPELRNQVAGRSTDGSATSRADA